MARKQSIKNKAQRRQSKKKKEKTIDSFCGSQGRKGIDKAATNGGKENNQRQKSRKKRIEP
jgi:hypothetical protein